MTETLANTEQAALEEFARELAVELGISNQTNAVEGIVSKIRWYPRGNPPAIVIVRRGGDRKVLATISPKSGKWTHLYPSWERVLTELATRKAAENVARRTHDDLSMGEVPVSKELA